VFRAAALPAKGGTVSADQPKKRCFVITPIGPTSSPIRRTADGLIDPVIKPIPEELGFEVHIPRKMTDPGSITGQVIQHLLDDDDFLPEET
jgi:hypothetical protein